MNTLNQLCCRCGTPRLRLDPKNVLHPLLLATPLLGNLETQERRRLPWIDPPTLLGSPRHARNQSKPGAGPKKEEALTRHWRQALSM